MPLQAPPLDAEKLQQAIRSARLTYAELARRSGLERSTVRDIATGRRNGRYETHDAIADALGVDVHDLYVKAAS